MKYKKVISIIGLKIDNDFNIIGLNCTYNYKDDDVATFSFSYDVKNKKIENVDISS